VVHALNVIFSFFCFINDILLFHLFVTGLLAPSPGREFGRCTEENGGKYVEHIFFFLFNFSIEKKNVLIGMLHLCSDFLFSYKLHSSFLFCYVY
jgi:hypothetical protein